MKKQHYPWLLGGIVLLGAIGYQAYLKSERLDPEYQERLDLIVGNREFSIWHNAKTKTRSWRVDINIPEVIPREKWDAIHTQPQLMFTTYVEGKGQWFYTMNINGTGVRLLATSQELGGSAEMDGVARPVRSPDGRYLAINYFAGSCILYDLKTKERNRLGDNKMCLNYRWTKDSQAVYFTKDYNYRYQINDHTLETVQPQEGTEIEGVNFWENTKGVGLHLVEAQDLLVIGLHSDTPNLHLGNALLFRLSDMSYLGREHYFNQPCVGRRGYSLDYQSFVCGDGGGGVQGIWYQAKEPAKPMGEIPQHWIVQEGRWYMAENGSMITRLRQEGEDSPLPALNYLYRTPEENDSVGSFAYYLPANLTESIDQLDLRPFFPTLPTQEQYQASHERQLKERKRGQR